jgi:hypothetical protein
VVVLGEFVDRAGADDLRGRREWRRLLNTGDAPAAGDDVFRVRRALW